MFHVVVEVFSSHLKYQWKSKGIQTLKDWKELILGRLSQLKVFCFKFTVYLTNAARFIQFWRRSHLTSWKWMATNLGWCSAILAKTCSTHWLKKLSGASKMDPTFAVMNWTWGDAVVEAGSQLQVQSSDLPSLQMKQIKNLYMTFWKEDVSRSFMNRFLENELWSQSLIQCHCFQGHKNLRSYVMPFLKY
jgi:hypothetical protein